LLISVDRLSPLMDELSAQVRRNRIHFLHPGRYSIALSANARRLVEITVDVRSPKKPVVLEATQRRQLTLSDALETSLWISDFLPLARTVVVSGQSKYDVLQDSPAAADQSIWEFVSNRLDSGEKVLVSWPGLVLGSAAAELLRRLRLE